MIKKKKERKGKSVANFFFFKKKERKRIKKEKNRERVVGEGLTISRSFFRPRNTSCFLVDLRSVMSEGSSSAYSTASAS